MSTNTHNPKAGLTVSDYKAYGSVAGDEGGSYIQLFRRDGTYYGDICFFEGNRPLAELKRLHELLERAILVLELHEKQETPQTRFERL